MPGEFRVLEQRRIPSSRDGRQGKVDRLVYYQVGDGPVRIVKVPDETFSESALAEAVRKDQLDLTALAGKTLRF